jgi:hypothetical protein
MCAPAEEGSLSLSLPGYSENTQNLKEENVAHINTKN